MTDGRVKVTNRSKSRRSPLTWSAYPPSSVGTVPNGRQRAAAHREGVFWNSVPGTDHKHRTLHGFTEYPTVEDGYEATVALRLLPGGGIRIVSMELRPSQDVIEDENKRERRPEEQALSPIDSAAWSLVRISDIKRAIAAIDADVVDMAPRLREEVEAYRKLTAQRRSPKIEERQARWAEQTLQAMAASDSVAYRRLLPDMFFEDWGGCTDETIKQRVRRLRKDGWLPPPDQYGRPGPRLLAWGNERGTGSTERRTNGPHPTTPS